MTIQLWFIRETEKARRYCKVPKARNPGPDIAENENFIWVPRSVCEKTLKWPPDRGEWPVHEVDVEDWFADSRGL